MLLDTDKSRLVHMIEAATEALDYVRERNRSLSPTDRPMIHVLLWNLLVLGEAASRISSQLRADHPEIPWREMIDTRNRIVHAYFDINMDLVWNTVQERLPHLIPQLRAILDQETLGKP